MIEIKNLHKTYLCHKVLNDINLHIDDGEIFGIVGRSGEGKSTILKCINGLETYDSGSIKVDGLEIGFCSDKDMRSYRRNIGMIFQQFPLMSRKTIYQNIAIPLECWGYDKKYIDKRVHELAKIVEIEDKLTSRPEGLSGGQKQRVAIARALSLNPKFLLCDEATSALDPKTTQSILNLLDKVNKQLGITIIVVSHQMYVVKKICDRVAIIENGTIVSQGDVRDIFYNEPDALKCLIGEDHAMELPKQGVNIKIAYDANDPVNDDIISSIGSELHIPFSLIWTNTDNYKNGKIIWVIINIPKDEKHRIIDFLNEKNVWVKVIDNGLR